MKLQNDKLVNYFKKNNLIKLLFSEKVLIIVFNVYFFTVAMNTTTLVIDITLAKFVLKIIRYTSYLYMLAFLFFLMVNKRIRLSASKESVNIFVLMVLSIGSLMINFTFTDNRILMLSMLMILGFGFLNIEKIIQDYFHNQLITIAIVISLCTFGVIHNYQSIRGNTVRHALGFDYPTNLSQFVMFAMLYRIYLRKFTVNYLELLVYQVITVFTFVITDSRTELLFMEILIIFTAVYPHIHKLRLKNLLLKVEKWFVNLYLLLPTMSVVLMLAYGIITRARIGVLSKIFVIINKVLSNRLHQSWMNFSKEGITLFGSKTELVGFGASGLIRFKGITESNFIDNDYLNLLFTKGWIFFITINLLIFIMLKILLKQEKHGMLFICFIILMFGFINPRILSIEYSILGLLMFNTLYPFINQNKNPLLY